MTKIILIGGASHKEIDEFIILDTNKHQTLLEFLINKNIPIASSCNGEQICHKCTVEIENESIMSCSIKLSELIHLSRKIIFVKVNYL